MSNLTDTITKGGWAQFASMLSASAKLSRAVKVTFAATLAASLLLVSVVVPEAEARHKASHSVRSSRASSSARSSGRSRSSSRGSSRSSSRSRVSSRSSSRHVAHGRHHTAAHRHHAVAHQAAKPRYAYPIGLFMRNAPAFDSSPFDDNLAGKIASAFDKGLADSYPARSLVRAGIVKYHPLHGGIFWRREPVKYIVMHSTETGVPVSAWRVIEGWNSMGIRHPGAQYVVERDGTIYQAVDPDLATVHVNIFKTLPGINNDNSIGIEINHTGSQGYPAAQLEAVNKLVVYLQHRYNVVDENIITHRYAQQGDHTDPVNFDWAGFIASKNSLRNQAIAYRENHIKDDARRWRREVEVPVNTYLKPHSEMREGSSSSSSSSSSGAAGNNASNAVAPVVPTNNAVAPVKYAPLPTVPVAPKYMPAQPASPYSAPSSPYSAPALNPAPSNQAPSLGQPGAQPPAQAPAPGQGSEESSM